jgi:hypothetical protein
MVDEEERKIRGSLDAPPRLGPGLKGAIHHPIRIGDERERLVTTSLVMTKSWGPRWGKQLPGERPRETAET